MDRGDIRESRRGNAIRLRERTRDDSAGVIIVSHNAISDLQMFIM